MLKSVENMLEPVEIYGHMWESVEIYGNLWKYVEICRNLWKSVEIWKDIKGKPVEICGNLWRPSGNILEIWGNKGALTNACVIGAPSAPLAQEDGDGNGEELDVDEAMTDGTEGARTASIADTTVTNYGNGDAAPQPEVTLCQRIWIMSRRTGLMPT